MTAHLPCCFADHDPARPCPCHHSLTPPWSPSEPSEPCDHGWKPAPAGATTGGVHGATYIPGSHSPTAQAKCATCNEHARQLREARA